MSADFAKGRDLPVFDGRPGEQCRECGETIRRDGPYRMCHSCRVRPHLPLVAELAREVQDATDDHSVRVSIAFAIDRMVRQERVQTPHPLPILFDWLDGETPDTENTDRDNTLREIQGENQ